MLYGITATVSKLRDDWLTVHQVPTFYLNSEVQGILSKSHAAQIAEDIINPTKDTTIKVDVTVYEKD